jgi:UDP-N-acetylmuramoyl-tripeptide--D-alanyl-D-alanine ligase
MAALATATCRRVTYGLARGADVRPESVEALGAEGSRLIVAGFPPIRLRLAGRHQAVNALAALAVARDLKLDPAAVAAALEAYAPSRGRMEVRALRGATLLVDCYNANPESTRAALETLASWPGASRRIAVLGDMLELGAEAATLHRDTAGAAHGADLWAVGTYAADYAAGARAAGIESRVFADLPALAAALGPALAPGVVVLLKASRGAALERVLDLVGTER